MANVKESAASDDHSKWRDRGETTQQFVIGVPTTTDKRDRGMLTILNGPGAGNYLPVDKKEAMTFGRGSDANHRIDDRGLSRRHARIFHFQHQYWVEDLQSTNGTFVNGVRISQPTLLRDDDRIQMGQTFILGFQLQDELQQKATERLYESATKDPLTHLYNRRFLDERLMAEVAFAVRHRAPLTGIIVDLDHFKSVNDTFGHPAGDEVLRQTAATMMRLVRTEDVCARYGGEEFAVLARGTNDTGGLALAERLRVAIAAQSVPLPDGRHLSVTGSLGVATLDALHPYAEGSSLLAAADQALYRAKESGRNRVIHAALL